MENCRCEEDHVIELRLVVAALNRQKFGVYRADGWQSELVGFFEAEFQNSARLPQRLLKIRAVNNWLDDRNSITDAEMAWIDEIRKKWADVKVKLPKFEYFKKDFDVILDTIEYRQKWYS